MAFGEGPYRLLKGVDLTGSFKEAATLTGMAYSKARRLLTDCEYSLGFALVLKKRKGERRGGICKVTADAMELIKKYEALRADVEDAVATAYRKHFGETIPAQFYIMITPKRSREV